MAVDTVRERGAVSSGASNRGQTRMMCAAACISSHASSSSVAHCDVIWLDCVSLEQRPQHALQVTHEGVEPVCLAVLVVLPQQLELDDCPRTRIPSGSAAPADHLIPIASVFAVIAACCSGHCFMRPATHADLVVVCSLDAAQVD